MDLEFEKYCKLGQSPTTVLPSSDSANGRKKIEVSVGDSCPFSFSLLDSICGSDEDQEEQDQPCSSSAERDFIANCGSEDDLSCVVSPPHLMGDLKVGNRHGVARFELSLRHSGDVLVAKTWNDKHLLNWVYTFHAFQGGKKRNRGSSSIVGRMQVHCHQCGSFGDTMMTEFVLYGLPADEPEPEPDSVGLDPSHEIAAIVIQAPFEKRESLKHRTSVKSLQDLCLDQQTLIDDSTTVNVVTPLGNHGLPNCQTEGPRSLLERWRLGGGCDCGGWDMACPLMVFDNLDEQSVRGRSSLLQDNQPFKMYLKGAKEKSPALAIKYSREGHYSIDFHAQLSALQAFAICVSVLHASQASSLEDPGMRKQVLQCGDEEVKILIEAIANQRKGEKRGKGRRATKDHPHLFGLNPPFSPIAKG